LGIDTLRGLFDRSLGTVDAFGLLGGRAGSLAAFVAQLGLDAFAGRDRGEDARKLAEVDRLAVRVAKFSADQLPLVLVIDDAERFDGRLLDRLVTGLIDPVQSRVLVVLACDSAHPNSTKVVRPGRLGTGRVGDRREALRLSRELLADRERVLGVDHPDTLHTRSNIAYLTGEVCDRREALRLLHDLLPHQEEVLGADHPDTLTTRNSIAFWTVQVGDRREALRLFQELLPDRERVLGAQHPDTVATRNEIGRLEGASGPDEAE
jgi:hypothetical protein